MCFKLSGSSCQNWTRLTRIQGLTAKELKVTIRFSKRVCTCVPVGMQPEAQAQLSDSLKA